MTIYIYVLTLAAAMFAALLAVRSRHLNRYKNKFYLASVFFTMLILLSELLGTLSEQQGWRILNIITNVFTYALCPMINYCLVMMNVKKWGRKEKLLMIPGLVVAIGSFTTQWTGLLFYVDASNHYVRGSLFGWTFAVSIFYYIGVIYTSYKEYRDADFQDKLYLLAIFLVVAVGVFIQIIDTNIRSMWPTVSICLLLYYVFTLEMSAKYDFLTGVRNRNAYDQKREMLVINHTYGLVIFDINGLKSVNDELGHREGDRLITAAAGILVDAFWGYGKLYRIGGDEFVLVFEKCDEKTIRARLTAMEQMIEKSNKAANGWKLSISYGIDTHPSDDRKTYEQVFENADNKMYEMKKNYYKQTGKARRDANA